MDLYVSKGEGMGVYIGGPRGRAAWARGKPLPWPPALGGVGVGLQLLPFLPWCALHGGELELDSNYPPILVWGRGNLPLAQFGWGGGVLVQQGPPKPPHPYGPRAQLGFGQGGNFPPWCAWPTYPLWGCDCLVVPWAHVAASFGGSNFSFNIFHNYLLIK